MGRDLLDVEEAHTVVREDGRHREEREVREVLVVDGVELVVPHQLEEVRELHGDDAVGGEQRGHAADEVVEVGHVREHVVAQQQVGSRALVAEPRRQLGAEELDQRRDPAFLRRRRDVGRRLDAEDGQLALDEVLEEVAVVAGDLDDLVRRSEVEPRRRLLDVRAGVLQPAPRERREVRVVAEDLLGRLELGELHQVALRAYVCVQRVEALSLIEPVGAHVGVGERRQAEVAERLGEGGAAESAGGGGAHSDQIFHGAALSSQSRSRKILSQSVSIPYQNPWCW